MVANFYLCPAASAPASKGMYPVSCFRCLSLHLGAFGASCFCLMTSATWWIQGQFEVAAVWLFDIVRGGTTLSVPCISPRRNRRSSPGNQPKWQCECLALSLDRHVTAARAVASSAAAGLAGCQVQSGGLVRPPAAFSSIFLLSKPPLPCLLGTSTISITWELGSRTNFLPPPPCTEAEILGIGSHSLCSNKPSRGSRTTVL